LTLYTPCIFLASITVANKFP